MNTRILTAENGRFKLNGKDINIYSGAIHYFRVPKCYWRERLMQLAACGFNTVETYAPWNLHEKRRGEFDFSDMLDVKEFIRIADELGLLVIIRPGPYICAEWEFGGFPAWLLRDDNIRLRCNTEPYMTYVKDYLRRYSEEIIPFLGENGGNVIAIQIENEYGSYGNDKEYLEAIKQIYLDMGIRNTFFFTSDGPWKQYLDGGTLPDVHAVANFGSNARERLGNLKEYRPDAPLMCGEYWNGWFDHWGEEHHIRESDIDKDINEMMDMDASFNMYMFHGGTNFGFLNGANTAAAGITAYMPTVSSYDYDCLISEWGGYTEKYRLVRDIMANRVKSDLPPMPREPERRAYGKAELTEAESFITSFKKYGEHFRSASPEPMEKYGQSYGYIVYETKICGPLTDNYLIFPDIHDRGYIFLDGEYVGTVYRNDKEKKLLLPDTDKEEVTLTILVENMGRVNYGWLLKDRKGLTDGVILKFQYLFGWDVYTLPFENVPEMKDSVTPDKTEGAVFLKGKLIIDSDEPLCHTFLRTDGFKRGFAVINGFNLGRFNCDGPTKTLYVPACLIKHGENEIFIFDQEGIKDAPVSDNGFPVVSFVSEPDLG